MQKVFVHFHISLFFVILRFILPVIPAKINILYIKIKVLRYFLQVMP